MPRAAAGEPLDAWCAATIGASEGPTAGGVLGMLSNFTAFLRLNRWHARLRSGDFTAGILSSPSIEELASIGSVAARYIARGLSDSMLGLTCAQIEVEALTDRSPDPRHTARFLGILLDHLPAYPSPAEVDPYRIAIEADLALVDAAGGSSVEIESWRHEAVAEILLRSELLTDVITAIAVFLAQNPDPATRPALERRVACQLMDPSAGFSGRYEALSALLSAIEAVEAVEAVDEAESMWAGIDPERASAILHACSAPAHLVPDPAGDVLVAGRGRHRLRKPASHRASFRRLRTALLPFASDLLSAS